MMSKNKVYVVMCTPEFGELKISQEAYMNVSDAKKFIYQRGDSPIKISEMKYKGKVYTYTIHELVIV